MPTDEELLTFSFFSDREIRPHAHRDIEIIYLLEGTLCLKIENDVFEMHEEDFLVINTGRQHTAWSDEDYLAVSFYINYQMLSSIMRTGNILFWCNTVEEKNSLHDEIRHLLSQIVKQYFNLGQIQTELFLKGLQYQLIYRLTLDFIAFVGPRETEASPGKRATRLQDIESYVQANYQRAFTLNEMAERMYLTPGYLSKYIRKNMNMRFTDYVISVRLFHAVEDILYTNKPITRIIYDNGFSNPAVFDKLFQKNYGMTPSSYRSKMKTESGQNDAGKGQSDVPASRIQTYLDRSNLLRDQERGKRTIVLSAQRGKEEYDLEQFVRVINIGNLEDLLDARMQEHVLILCRELKFTHLRVWNIFQEDMYHEFDDGTWEYNFMRIDKVLDFLTENKIHAYLELETKSRNLMRDPQRQIDLDSLDPETPYLFPNYLSVIRRFSEHLVNRYGISEIEQWFFELRWPNGVKFLDAQCYDLFRTVKESFGKFSDKIRVGGFGMLIESSRDRLAEVISWWEEQEILPDFISLYLYPYVFWEKDGRASVARSTDESYPLHQISQIREIFKGTKLEKCPIHVSQWSNTLSNRCVLNDSCFKGAYIMKNFLECQRELEVMAYWHGSDLYGAASERNSVCFGECGLLTVDGCRKPAFYGMMFVNSLYNTVLARNDYAVISTDGKDKYRIACHNYQHYGYKFYLTDEDKMDEVPQYELFEDYEGITIRFQIRDVRNGNYRMRIQYVNHANGSIQDELSKMGDVQEVSASEMRYLQKICISHMRVAFLCVTDGILQFESTLQPNEIQLIELDYQFSDSF